MANTLTNLAPELFAAKDIVARELAGGITSTTINRDGGVLQAAYRDTIRSHVTAQPTLNTSYSPSMTIPEGDDQTVSSKTFALDSVANVRIHFTGEEMRKLDNGPGYQVVLRDMFTQALRKIVNTIEAKVLSVAYQNASRAVGTAGTAPFGSNYEVLADLLRILEENGIPNVIGDTSVVFNSSATANLRKLAKLLDVNTSGSDDLLRRGELLNLYGMSLKQSAGVASHTKGAGTGYLINNGNVAIGSTVLSVDGGTVNTTGFKQGDVITIADDPSAGKYIVHSGLTAAAGTITIGDPGLMGAIGDGEAVTIGNSYTANVAFHRSAVELAMRAPAQPYGGDAAVDRMTISDPLTGLSFEVAEYKGYGKVMYDITTFYGVKVWKPEFVAVLLG